MKYFCFTVCKFYGISLRKFTCEKEKIFFILFKKHFYWRFKKCVAARSLRSWRDCKRTRNKVLAAEPASERRSREENGERDFEIPLFLAALPLALEAPPPKLYFALAIPPATQARLPAVSLWIPIALVRLASYADILCPRHAIFLPHERVLKPREYSLPFSVCSQPDQGFGLFPEDRPEIT